MTNIPERKLILAKVELILNFDSIFSFLVCLFSFCFHILSFRVLVVNYKMFVFVKRLARDLVVMKSKRRKLSKWRIMILPWKRKYVHILLHMYHGSRNVSS